MSLKPTYSLAEFWSDLRSVNHAKSYWGLIPSFDEQVKNHFESMHGGSNYTLWRYGRFMLVMIYINTNKTALDVGELAVAGPGINDGVLISNKLAERVLRYAVEHPITMVNQFPPPKYFIEDEKA